MRQKNCPRICLDKVCNADVVSYRIFFDGLCDGMQLRKLL